MNEPTSGLPWLRWRSVADVLRPFLALIVVTVIFCVADSLKNGANAQFASEESIRNVAAQTMIVLVGALGVTLVIISGGIDLSVGTAIALCATVLAWSLKEDVALLFFHGDNIAGVTRKLEDAEKQVQQLSRKLKEIQSSRDRTVEDQTRSQGIEAELGDTKFKVTRLRERLDQTREASKRFTPFTPWFAFPLALAAGCLCGLVNGVLISQLRLVPFIVTLGTMQLYLGLAKWLADNTTVRPDRSTQVPAWVPDLLSIREKAQWLGLPLGVWLTLVLAILVAAVLRYSVFGRYVFAIGSNEATARLCGINVNRNKIAIYTLCGLFVGIAGLFQFSRLTVGNPTSGLGLELRVIASVVIGGASLNGGRGTIVGTLCGSLIMSVITSGCSALGVSNPVQDMLLGIIIIVAVAVDQFRQQRVVQ